MENNSYNQKIFLLLFFFAIILLGFLCKVLSSVMLPVVTAILLAFVFKRLPTTLYNKLKIPYLLSCIFIILLNYEGYLCAYSTNSRKTAAAHSFRLLRIWASSVDADTGFTT